MTLLKEEAPLKQTKRPSGKNRRHGILSAQEFKALLLRERARTDRNGGHFSVLVFNPVKGVQRNGLSGDAALLNEVKDRKRLTDDIGYFDSRRIGIFLSDTDAEGAETVAIELCARMGLLASDFVIYTYSALHSDEPALQPETGKEESGSNDEFHTIRTLPADRSRTRELDWYFMQRMPIGKRIVDILGAVAVLILVSPIMLLAALTIKLTSKGPIIFTQQRVGKGGNPFKFYKFRSMVIDAEERKKDLQDLNEKDGPIFKIRNDPRITRVGHFLRKTSIDELPQLWNVLKGDMSLVGPRPPTVDEIPRYEAWQKRRLEMTGGLTCLWQVSGRSNIGFEDWMRMDIEYMEKRSLWYDLILLLRTPFEVITGRGAH